MQGKRFVASNMRLALKMVREELGPDAIILSNKQVAEGVELLTAVDSTPSVASEKLADRPDVSDNPFVQQETVAESVHSAVSPGASRLEREVERMQQDARKRAERLAAAFAQKHKALSDTAEVKASTTSQSSDISRSVSAVKRVDGLGDQRKPRASVTPPSADNDDTAEFVKHDELRQMRCELQSMRDLLEQQLSSMAWGQYTHNSPEKASIWRRLKRMGIDADVANTLIDTIGYDSRAKDSWQLIMEKLSGLLSVASYNITARGGVFAFVGPTGAGKTTTIAKLAAQYVLENGAEDVALITTDTLRIAAQEQLRMVSRILNVPMKTVDKHHPLDRVLHSLRHKSLVLIDTAGMNQGDLRLNQQLNAINEFGGQIRSLLVIPATSQGRVIKAAVKTYKTDNLSACILTKLDETASLGESLCALLENNLPVAYCTNGQNIPQDIAAADRVELVKTAIELAKHTQVNDKVMVDEMVSLSRGS